MVKIMLILIRKAGSLSFFVGDCECSFRYGHDVAAFNRRFW